MDPRGIRNNNPCNLRLGQQWQGMADEQADPAFVQFKAPEWGIRAACVILKAYETKHDISTIRGAINRWAPPSENDTDAYVSAVAQECGEGPDDTVSLTVLLPMLVPAIIRHENGVQPYSDDIIAKGIALA